MTKRPPASLIAVILIVLLLSAITVSAFLGSGFSLVETGRFFVQKLPVLGRHLFPDDLPGNIDKAMNLRLPRILLAAVVGAGLAVSGAVFQSLFRNPLADPYFLGVSAGASFGTTLAVTLGAGAAGFLGQGLSAVAAFGFALGAILIVYALARSRGRVPLANLVLAGIAVSSVLTAFVSALMLVARERLERIVLVTMGSFARADFDQLAWVAPATAAGILCACLFARDLNLFLFGEEHAAGLGLEVEKRKRLLLVAASFTAAIAVAASGIIWFAGLIVPHMVRLLSGPDNRRLLPLSALAGALLLVVADTLARTLFPPYEIPIGILTALAGAPFFIYLLQKRKKTDSAVV